MAADATSAFRETQEIARKEVLLRYKTKKDFSPYNTAGCLGELQVAVIVIKILERIPLFLSNHHDLRQVLSGKLKIQEMASKDGNKRKNASYYHFLQDFSDLLYNLRDNMKKHLDFLDNFFVNLSPFYLQTDNRDFWIQETFKCFQKYVSLFCNLDSKDLTKNRALSYMDKIEKTRQWLEKNNADSYIGLLKFLATEGNESPRSKAQTIEHIVTQYTKLQNEGGLKDAINLIYANIVLSKIKPESQILWPHEKLLKLLCKILEHPVPLSDSLALHFVAVMMLWPESNVKNSLPIYVSQMKSSFSNEMIPVCNGKRAAVHFYLGKSAGYCRMITQNDIDTCVSSQQLGKLQNEKIWENKKIQNMLHRVTGRISNHCIMANTSNPHMQVAVSPLFKCQLCGYLGDNVSFFVGFSMDGPVAVGIKPES